MSVTPVERSVPETLRLRTRETEVEGLIALYSGRYRDAEILFRRQYETFLAAQSEEGRPIHKGGPLHNLGLSILVQGPERFEEGLRNILLAYIEDVLSSQYNEEDEADRAPAATFLRDIVQIRLRILAGIKSFVRGIKSRGLWSAQTDPSPILAESARAMGIEADNFRSQCAVREIRTRQMPLGFPQPWESRVFVGGDYSTHGPIILEIREAVIRKGYTPVIPFEVAIPPELIRHHSLMLLHTCRFAIFEISSAAGQFMEIERARDYDTITLLVRSAIDPSLQPRVSNMITTAGFRIEYYRDMPELRQIVARFLP